MAGINKAVIPAAGLGTRLKPLTNYMPKSMLPLGTKPVLQHIVEELHEAGVNNIAIVIRPEYKVVQHYFEPFPGVTTILDDSTGGPAQAVMACREFTGSEPFLVIFADAPVYGKARGNHLASLCQLVESGKADAAVSIYRVPEDEISRRGVVTFLNKKEPLPGEPVLLRNFKEKPARNPGRSNWAATCRYALKPNIYRAIRSIDTDDEGELQLTTAIRFLLEDGKTVYGVPMADHLNRHDTGNFEGYFRAFSEFAGTE